MSTRWLRNDDDVDELCKCNLKRENYLGKTGQALVRGVVVGCWSLFSLSGLLFSLRINICRIGLQPVLMAKHVFHVRNAGYADLMPIHICIQYEYLYCERVNSQVQRSHIKGGDSLSSNLVWKRSFLGCLVTYIMHVVFLHPRTILICPLIASLIISSQQDVMI